MFFVEYGFPAGALLINNYDLRMKKKGDHRPRNSAQCERVVELLIMHNAKRTPRQKTPRQISLSRCPFCLVHNYDLMQ